jgi:hypothetical protein
MTTTSSHPSPMPIKPTRPSEFPIPINNYELFMLDFRREFCALWQIPS